MVLSELKKGWRKIFEKDYFRDFIKMTKLKKNLAFSNFLKKTIASTETNYTSAELMIMTRVIFKHKTPFSVEYF